MNIKLSPLSNPDAEPVLDPNCSSLRGRASEAHRDASARSFDNVLSTLAVALTDAARPGDKAGITAIGSGIVDETRNYLKAVDEGGS